MNSNIISQFEILINQVKDDYTRSQMEGDPKEITSNEFRLRSLRKALQVIKKLDINITDANQLKGIPGIGKGTISRINEILSTGKLAEIKNNTKINKDVDSMQELENVIGIGPATAKKLIKEHKITSVDKLKAAVESGTIKVTSTIELGLKYYGIVKDAIPRKEITATVKYLKSIAKKIDKNLEVMVCGSYRRGKATSGDIDVLLFSPNIITKNDISKKDSMLNKFVQLLEKNKFILDGITSSSDNIKYMGFSKYNNYPVRRIDIRYIPFESLPTAQLYFTGPYELNTIMRKEAKKRNLKLNEYGLFNEKNGRKIDVNSEQDVFEKLGMEYMDPTERELYSTGKNKKLKK